MVKVMHASNLKRFRQFYLVFRKDGAVRHQLSWTHIRKLLPIKDENKRNYFINLVLKIIYQKEN